MSEPLDYDKLYRVFETYQARPRFEVEHETKDLHFGYTASQYVSGRTVVKLSVDFPSDRFIKFGSDMIRLSEMDDEQHLRDHYPSLQKAYDEYQILLKLLK
jgi:hypothetical protein